MLSTKTGKISMKKCIYNASGVGCRTHQELLKLNNWDDVGSLSNILVDVY